MKQDEEVEMVYFLVFPLYVFSVFTLSNLQVTTGGSIDREVDRSRQGALLLDTSLSFFL